MDFSKHTYSEWALRLGLGFLFLYSGLDLVRHPTAWYWAVRPLPWIIQDGITRSVGIDRYLQMQGAVELGFALVFFAWFLPRRMVRIIALVVAVEMAGILFLVGLSGDTFRDIGLLGAAAALFFMNQANHGSGLV